MPPRVKPIEKMQWYRMKNRCARHPHYAGRIHVCARWASFDAFMADMGDAPSPRHSIDRIDGSRDYSPENCRWATRKEQMRNTTRNFFVDAFSERKTAVEWAEDPRYQVSYKTLHARVTRLGWTPEQMIIQPTYGIRHEHGRKPRRKSA